MRFKIEYTFEEEVEYNNKEEAKRESEHASEGIATTEGLTIVSVKVEEISDGI